MDDQPSTRQIAGRQAAAKSALRYKQIMAYLEDHGEGTLWEIAAAIGVPDHTISGRITELLEAEAIEPTGARRAKPASRCPARVYRIRQPLLWVDSLFPNISQNPA